MKRMFSTDFHVLAMRVCGAITMLLGAEALVGWYSGWTVIASIRPDYIPMAPNTSLAFLALGFALIAHSFRPGVLFIRWVAGVASLLVVVLTVVTLFRYYSDIGPVVDHLLFRTDETVDNFPKGHMSPITAAALILSSSALLLLQIPAVAINRVRSASSIMSGLAFLVGLTVLLGYSYGTPLLYGGSVIPIAITSALAITFINIGLIAAAGPEAWPYSLLTGPTIHARLLRVFLPLVVLAIFVDGWLIVGVHEWFNFNPAFIAALTAIILVIPVSVLLNRISAWVGGSIDRANAERQRAEEQILESETKLRAIFEKSRDAIGVSRAGTHVLVNPAYLEMFGYQEEEELIGGSILDLIAPSQKEEISSNVRRRRIGEPVQAFYETRGLRKDGSEFDMETSVSTYEIKGETYSLALIRDITERKLLEQQLIQSQKMESIGKLAGGVAHDFNNYLTAVLGYTDLALGELPDDSPVREDLLEARKSGERLTDLTHQLLLFSRRETVELKPTNLNRVIVELLKMLGRLVGENFALVTELEEKLWVSNVDASHISQIIMNLVVNSRDAMPDGGKIVIKTENQSVNEKQAAAIREARPGEFVCLSVADDGVGLDEETKANIFEPFFSTKEVGRGTGLGLSVVYGIVSQHAGWIAVESSLGRGTTFRVYFPRTMEEIEAVASPSGQAADLQGGGERILLVEDEEAVRSMAAKTLAMGGYQVLLAASAEEALKLFKTEEVAPDLVFSDVVLPGKDGVWLMERLLEMKSDVPVLLASGYSYEKLKGREERYTFLQKPYAPAALLRTVKVILEK